MSDSDNLQLPPSSTGETFFFFRLFKFPSYVLLWCFRETCAVKGFVQVLLEGISNLVLLGESS